MNSKNMTGKNRRGQAKFIILGLLLLVVLCFFLSHFWSFTLCAIQDAVAFGMVPRATGTASLLVSKFFRAISAMHFLL